MSRIPHSRPTLGDDEARAAAEVTASGRLADGVQCRAFEEELCAAVGRRHAVVVSSGHAALELWVESSGLAPGSEVRVPDYVCAALRHGLERRGLVPACEDVEADTLGLAAGDGAAIAANMFAVPAAGATGSALEDCAMGFVPGSTGARSASCLLSFYVTKMLTTGQGGCLLTDDDALADEWRDLMRYDNRESWRPATNRSMTDIQAAVGRVQLRRYPEFLDRRRDLLARYRRALSDIGATLHPVVGAAADGVLFRLPLQVEPGTTDSWIRALDELGVEAKRPVWRPMHVDAGGEDGDFPVSVAAQDTIVSLPFYPSLTDDEFDRVVAAVGRVLPTLT